jgi:hypothetical protein
MRIIVMQNVLAIRNALRPAPRPADYLEYPGVDQAILVFTESAMALDAECRVAGMTPSQRKLLVDRVAKSLVIGESMGNSRLLRDAPDEFSVTMAPMSRRLYQEKWLIGIMVAMLRRVSVELAGRD